MPFLFNTNSDSAAFVSTKEILARLGYPAASDADCQRVLQVLYKIKPAPLIKEFHIYFYHHEKSSLPRFFIVGESNHSIK